MTDHDTGKVMGQRDVPTRPAMAKASAIEAPEAEGHVFWTCRDVMRELDVSRPTAYKLMHGSGLATKPGRALLVYAPDFVAWLRQRA